MLVLTFNVRRLLANSLLLAMVSIFFAPALTAAAAQPVPICCRRGGTHHCAAMAQMVSPDGKTFRSNNPCPMRQTPQLASSVVALPASRLAQIELHRQALISGFVSRRHFTIAHPDYQRGPPALLT